MKHSIIIPPTVPIEVRDAIIKRFWRRVDKSGGQDACWLWEGSKRGGYGGFTITFDNQARGVMAHRFAYEITHGFITPGKVICHRCDVPLCVNPSHLFQGTSRENSKDRDSKGRGRLPKTSGTNNGFAKVNESIVREVRRLYSFRKVTCKALGQRFGVSEFCIRKIVRYERWKHII